MEPEDKDLILAVKAGDLDAFEALVKKYEGRALNFVFGITKDEPMSEEVLQDTFLKIYKNIDRIDISRKFSSYFYAILKNEAISALRKIKREVNLSEIEYKIESGEDLLEKIHIKETRVQIEAALGKLKAEYREVLKLYYFNDLSYSEIASKMKLPLNTVRTNLKRGKKELKKVLSIKY